MATYSSILAWRIPWTEEPGGLHTVHEVAKSWTGLSDFTLFFFNHANHSLDQTLNLAVFWGK